MGRHCVCVLCVECVLCTHFHLMRKRVSMSTVGASVHFSLGQFLYPKNSQIRPFDHSLNNLVPITNGIMDRFV